MTSAFDLTGRRAAVAGGLGKIGRAGIEALAQAGAEVWALDIAAAFEAERKSLPGKARFEPFDVTNVAAATQELESLDARSGGFDIWVYAAYPKSVGWASDSESGSDWSAYARAVEGQLVAPIALAETIARRMATRRRGSIVQIGSIYGLVAPDFSIYEGLGMGTPSAYAAVKGGLIGHTRWLAGRYGHDGVRVNLVAPGGVEADQADEFKRRYGARNMLGRMARTEEIGAPIAFLASDAANYITGAVLPIDGGWTAM